MTVSKPRDGEEFTRRSELSVSIVGGRSLGPFVVGLPMIDDGVIVVVILVVVVELAVLTEM
jgi:hypothetical protein